jgi:pyrroline-5-carboxylate reductase
MKITLIGCGNMGLIYARAILKYSIVKKEDLLLVEKNGERAETLKLYDIGEVVLADDPKVSESDLILLAVKPQDFIDLAPALKKVLSSKNLVLSIMAGITMKFIQEQLGTSSVVRAMPNSPAGVGMGVTAWIACPEVTQEQTHKAERLLSTTGRSVYLDDESQLDAVTALSGSGPAYFFYIVKHMIDAGKEMGIDEGISSMLVKQTMLGAFHLINQADRSLDELITAVASKGGTTEAAFSVFEETAVGDNIRKAILKSEDREKELSKN